MRQSQIKPDTYRVVVRREGYREEEYTVSIGPGQRFPLNVKLEPTSGIINVTPNVSGTEIIVQNLENNTRVGRYDERVSNLNVPPGRYEVAISKSGYRTATREVSVTASQSVYLEPPLEQLPPERPRVRGDAAMTIRTSTEGKLLIVELMGKSGDASRVAGAVEVTINPKGDAPVVSGMFPGYPCRVDFVRLENVAEYAFGEAPSAGNLWGRVIVRVRPKDSKRAMQFIINWTSLDSASGESAPGASTSDQSIADGAAVNFTPAVAVNKVMPRYPSSARTSRTEGVVVVSLEINEQGVVVSAKATDGPLVLRGAAEDAARQWKFSPARNGGEAVRSTQSVQFAFRF
jgi:TonB family protein